MVIAGALDDDAATGQPIVEALQLAGLLLDEGFIVLIERHVVAGNLQWNLH
jgi:hypothetical protein